MKTWPALIAVFALAGATACGGEATPEAPAKPAAAAQPPDQKAKGQAPVKKTGPKTAEERADEIIADLKKREAEQGKIQERATGRVPVVVEVSPEQRGSGAGGGLDASRMLSPGISAEAASNSADANYWRQEYNIAVSRMEASQRRLQEASRKMSEASQQGQSSNEALRKLGQEAYQRAQQEYSQAQNAYYEDQSAVSRARSAALQAGVPASALR